MEIFTIRLWQYSVVGDGDLQGLMIVKFSIRLWQFSGMDIADMQM